MTVIPAAVAIVTVEDATVDLVAFGHAAAVLRDRRAAGRLRGYIEAVYEANPGLAGTAAILPLGTRIMLPEFTAAATARTPRLWDE